MPQFRKHIWKEDGWERGDPIPGGNQGHAHFARMKDDPPNTFKYVLKVLRRQDAPDRRAMFCGEIRAMGVLDHKGVVEIAATNAEDYREDVELYLITRHVQGIDLEKLVGQEVLSVEDATRVTLRVLEIIDHCHNRGVIHRDIKPCHIIFRNNCLEDPVLIDFGLAYHDETQPMGAETQAGRGKGNRFHIGPEHLSQSPEVNRDPKTDITQCIGLFFFALTGNEPGAIRDELNRKPHERSSLESLWQDIPEWKRKAILRIFDVAFEWVPAYRWDSVAAIERHLEQLLEDTLDSDVAFGLDLDSIVQRSLTESYTSRLQRATHMVDALVDEVRSLLGIVERRLSQAEVKRYLSVSCGGIGRAGETLLNLPIHFKHMLEPRRSQFLRLGAKFANDAEVNVTLVLHSTSGQHPLSGRSSTVHSKSYALEAVGFPEDIRSVLQPQLSKCISEVLGIDSDSILNDHAAND